MTLPGSVAFFYMSGNYVIVFSFMLIIMMGMMLVEKIAEITLGNPLSTMFIAISMAYSFMNFYSPYLFLIKLAEIILLLFACGLFFRMLNLKERVYK